MMILPFVPAALTVWLTPLWLLSVGVTIAAVVLIVLLAALCLVSRSAARSVVMFVGEGILLPVTYLVIALVAFCLLATPTMPYQRMLSSLGRAGDVGVTTAGTASNPIIIPPRTVDQRLEIAFRVNELQGYEILSDQDIVVNMVPGQAITAPLIQIEGNEPYVWSPSGNRPINFVDVVSELYVTNSSDAPASFQMTVTTDVEMPEVHQIPYTASIVVAVYLAYFLFRVAAPRTSTIAVATAREAVAQPFYLLALIIGAIALVLFIYIPYNTFGEDVKMLKDSGLTTIMVLAILVGLWTASVSVADEIEGRTALTLLSKPISRRQFILGKFTGIVLALLLLFVLLGMVMLLTVSFKVVYDARETSNPTPDWPLCYSEMIRILPGLFLAFLETVTLTAISVAISTRLPMLPNLIICVSIYVLGHLGPLIVQSAAGQIEFVAFIGRLIALVFPVLDHFNIQAAVAAGVEVPLVYLATAALYCLIYVAVAMLLALAMFEDRDLA